MESCSDERLKPTFAEWHKKVSEAYAPAKSDNDRSYFEQVKPVSSLPKPERKRMVKTMPPPEESEQEAIMPTLKPQTSSGAIGA